MLTIRNIDKIIGMQIHNNWHVKSMNTMMWVLDMNGTYKQLYQIQIHNKITNSAGKIYLDRNYANKEIKQWYELSTTKGGKRHVQLITKDTIGDIKELLEHIKIVGLD